MLTDIVVGKLKSFAIEIHFIAATLEDLDDQRAAVKCADAIEQMAESLYRPVEHERCA